MQHPESKMGKRQYSLGKVQHREHRPMKKTKQKNWRPCLGQIAGRITCKRSFFFACLKSECAKYLTSGQSGQF